jgi:hypothetical protein
VIISLPCSDHLAKGITVLIQQLAAGRLVAQETGTIRSKRPATTRSGTLVDSFNQMTAI